MAVNVMKVVDDGAMPAELQIDLLVDGELSESDRHKLIRELEAGKGDGEWRCVALRFLQRQVEQKTVKDLMAGGRLVVPEVVQQAMAPAPAPLPFWRWARRPGVMATAAGLLIAATSAVGTLLVLRETTTVKDQAVVFHATVPGEAVGSSQNIPVSLPVESRDGGEVNNVLPAGMRSPGSGPGMQSVVIQPDGKGNFVFYSVSTRKVY